MRKNLVRSFIGNFLCQAPLNQDINATFFMWKTEMMWNLISMDSNNDNIDNNNNNNIMIITIISLFFLG